MVVRIRSASTLDHPTTAVLVIHQQRIDLGDDVDLQGLIAEILDAVRSGGAAVRVVSRYGREYDVIVTPSTEALICHEPVGDDDHSADGPWLTSVDLDHP